MSRVKLMLQTEMADCGTACLAMVLNYYGSRIATAVLIQRYLPSVRGTSLADLVRMANAFDFVTRAYYLKPAQLHTLSSPVILHWQANHYVVLDKTHHTRGYHILDPANGGRWLREEKFKQLFTGFALLLKPGAHYSPREEKTPRLYLALLRKIPGLVRHNSVIAVTTLMVQILALLFPLCLQKMVFMPSWREMPVYSIAALMSIKAGEIITAICRGHMINRFERLMLGELGTNVLRHLLALPYCYFTRHASHSIFMRFHSIEKIRELLSRGLIEGLIDGLMASMIILLISVCDIRIGAIIALLALIYLIIHSGLMGRAQIYNQTVLKETGKSSSFMLEMLHGIVTIKNFVKAGCFVGRWVRQSKKYLNAGRKLAHLQLLLDGSRHLLVGIQWLSILLLSWMDTAKLFVLLFYLNLFNKSLINACNKFFDLRLVQLHLDHINDILIMPREQDTPSSGIKKISEIQLQNISFRYHENGPWIVRDLSYTIKANESVVITGPSGCGKSTLLKLLMGLLAPVEGSIFINGLPMTDHLQSYRRLAGVVMQDDQIFSGTIDENISLFDEALDQERAWRCAAITGIDTDIQSMPMGYHSLLGGAGVCLSGGQTQRILLARALYAQPQLLFLDEAFCHLDKASENVLTLRLRSLGITRIVITHRQETLHAYDHVIDMATFRC